VSELDPRDESWVLPAGTEVVFLALHGTYGEDGTVQQRLDELGALYTGCDAESSRIAFDKVLTKELCLEAACDARYVVIDGPKTSWPMGWDPPVVLSGMPRFQRRLNLVERVSDWSNALTEAMRYDSRVLVEERISGRECTVGILGDEAAARLSKCDRGQVFTITRANTPLA